MSCDLFYDKYTTNDRTPSNPLTADVTIDSLSDGSYELLAGESAYNYFVKAFGESKHTPPKAILDNDKILLKIYKKQVKDVQHVYTVVNVITDIFTTKLTEVELLFLKMTCIYHHFYINYTKNINVGDNNVAPPTINNKLDQNTQIIHEKASLCVDYTNDARVDQPAFLMKPLFEYQKCNISWMRNKESNIVRIPFNLNEHIPLNNMFFDIENQTFNSMDDKNNIMLYGGGLIDEVGLGKTIQIITLSLLNKPEEMKEPVIVDKNYLKSNATLIICPNQLCNQWKREFTSMIRSDYPVKVLTFLSKRDYDKYTYEDVLNADFVILSYTFLDNQNFLQLWSPKISNIKSFNKSVWTDANKVKVAECFNTLRDELIKDVKKTVKQTMPLFQLVKWNRLIVDEFHEVNSVDKYKYVKNILPYFKSTYRWCVTATPFLDNKCVINIIKFLSNYELTPEEYAKVLLDDNIMDYMAEECFRKNTKKSLEEIEKFNLPGLEEEVKWLNFSATERMMYNAYLVNTTKSASDVYLRQLCCHPQLSNDTKNSLCNCKDLNDIEKMMVSHYKKDMDNAAILVDKTKEKIIKTTNNLNTIDRRRKKAKLIELGVVFKKKVDINQDIIDELEGQMENLEDYVIAVSQEEEDELDNVLDNLAKYKINPSALILKPTQVMENLTIVLSNLDKKLVVAIQQLEGKTASYNFFNNVVNRLRNNIGKVTDVVKDNTAVDESTDNIMDFYDNIEAEVEEEKEKNEPEEEKEICAICCKPIIEDCTGVTKCGHIFCYTCIKNSVTRYHNCPYCKKSLTLADVFTLAYEPPKKVVDEKELEKIDFVNKYGTKIANLILFLQTLDGKCILFSQWDDLLRRTGAILSENKIKNVFCRGNCFQRDKAIREFNSNDSIKAIMLSSESSASGTNLTTASYVIFLDPIYGNYEFRKDQERQAVGRAYRMGQQKVVKIIRFIIKDTIEDDIYKMNVTEDGKHDNSIDYNTLIETEVNV